MSEPSESAAESIHLAWQHLDAAAPPELRRWLQTGKPVALHEDLLMIAVPNNFTRNQLEIRFRERYRSRAQRLLQAIRAVGGQGRRVAEQLISSSPTSSSSTATTSVASRPAATGRLDRSGRAPDSEGPAQRYEDGSRFDAPQRFDAGQRYDEPRDRYLNDDGRGGFGLGRIPASGRSAYRTRARVATATSAAATGRAIGRGARSTPD